MKSYNREIVNDILKNMTQEKKAVLTKALERNFILTSSYVLSSCTLTVYKEGWLVKLEGTRSNFSVFAIWDDFNGEFITIRKPNESKLNKLYDEWQTMNEDDYKGF